MEITVRVVDGKMSINTANIPDKFVAVCLLLDAAKACAQPVPVEAQPIRVPPPHVQRQLIGANGHGG